MIEEPSNIIVIVVAITMILINIIYVVVAAAAAVAHQSVIGAQNENVEYTSHIVIMRHVPLVSWTRQ